HVLIDAVNSALQNREVAFGGIGRRISTNVLFLCVVDGSVTGEPLPGFPVDPALVSAQVRGYVDFSLKNGPKIGCVHLRDMPRADAAVPLNERDHSFLGRRSFVSPVPRFAANEGFVRLNEHTVAAKRPART